MASLETALELAADWGSQTLDELRLRAVAEPAGIAFTALTDADRGRICLVVGIADVGQALAGFVVEVDAACPVLDWSQVSAAEVALLARRTRTLFPVKSAQHPNALALIAAVPDSIQKLTRLFLLPP